MPGCLEAEVKIFCSGGQYFFLVTLNYSFVTHLMSMQFCGFQIHAYHAEDLLDQPLDGPPALEQEL